MPSVSVASAPSVFHVVSRTADPSRYRRDTWRRPITSSEKHPARSPPINRPKIGSESNRGRHIQSIEPTDEHSAAVRPSPISAYSPIAGVVSRFSSPCGPWPPGGSGLTMSMGVPRASEEETMSGCGELALAKAFAGRPRPGPRTEEDGREQDARGQASRADQEGDVVPAR